MTGSYDYRLVLLSLLVAFVSSLAAFSLAARVYRSEPKAARLWLMGGAVAMGSGIWSMHFVGMLAFSLPIPVGYAFDLTALSWLIAVAVSWLALKIASRPELTLRLLIMGGLLMGAGICGMHYTGMYAMRMSPPIVYDPALLLLSALIAVAASMLALRILFWLRGPHVERTLLLQMLAAAAMAAAITGMHYTGMAAAEFAPDSVCTAVAAAHPTSLAVTIALGAIGLILATFIIAIVDARMQTSTASLSLSLKNANLELSRMAMLDTLTQLPNRRLFQQHLEVGILRSSRMGNSLAVAFIDLDGFKPINDTLGHHIGDEVLRAAAKRLNAAVRGCDVVARIGGDEFVALIEDITSNQDIVPIVERIIHSMSDVFFVDHHEIAISASVGIAVYPRDGDMARLMVCADAAMYQAKSNGKNQFRFFDADIELASDRLIEMQRDLRHALSKDEFKLHFQPKVDSTTHALAGVEALLRWQHPVKGTILPAAFISAAERFGLVHQIGDWVIEEACRTLHRMRNQGIALKISINLSLQQFRNPNLVTNVLQLLQRFDLPPSSLMFEITESTATHNPEQFNTLLTAFREAGIEMAMDDFGTGHFSLAHLLGTKVSELKLDPTLIAEISTNMRSRAIIDAIVRLAHALQLRVVAEGVETEEQRKILVKLGCDQLQGFLFSCPVPEENLASLVRQLSANQQGPDGSGAAPPVSA